jgi:hypothetical protein
MRKLSARRRLSLSTMRPRVNRRCQSTTPPCPLAIVPKLPGTGGISRDVRHGQDRVRGRGSTSLTTATLGRSSPRLPDPQPEPGPEELIAQATLRVAFLRQLPGLPERLASSAAWPLRAMSITMVWRGGVVGATSARVSRPEEGEPEP